MTLKKKIKKTIDSAKGEVIGGVVSALLLEAIMLDIEEFNNKIMNTQLFDKNSKSIKIGDKVNLPIYNYNPVEVTFHQGVVGVTCADSKHYPLRDFTNTGTSSSEIQIDVEIVK